MSYVPGSEKAEDAEAIDRARGLLSGITKHLPSAKGDDSLSS